MMERFSAVSRELHAGLEFVGRHEVGIGIGLTIASPIYLSALNSVLGVGNDLNGGTVTEIGLVGLSASFFASAMMNRQKPSDIIRDAVSLTKSILSKNHQH